jgi:hypothetical protein
MLQKDAIFPGDKKGSVFAPANRWLPFTECVRRLFADNHRDSLAYPKFKSKILFLRSLLKFPAAFLDRFRGADRMTRFKVFEKSADLQPWSHLKISVLVVS